MQKIILVFLCFCLGCASAKIKEPPPEAPLTSFKILNEASLQKAGKLIIAPFRAGVNVEANEELNKIALMVVKGITEGIKEQNENNFEILSYAQAQDADLIIEGHITKLTKPSRINRMGLGDKKISLGLEGNMVNLETGEKVLIFSDLEERDQKGNTHQDIAYAMGRSIGQVIATGMNKIE